VERRKVIARGYISFAVEQSDLFRLMSRNELLDLSNEGSATQGERRFAHLRRRSGEMTAGWAYVHGLATLLIDGRLNSVPQISEDIDNMAALVEAAIERMRLSLAD